MKLGRLVSTFGELMVFDAEDDQGALRVVVPQARWERLCATGPAWMDADDRRDAAMQKVEEMAAAVEPATENGQRVVRLR